MPGVIGKLLSEKGLSLATMEDGTRGIIASTLTSVAGPAEYYRGGLIAYSDDVKINWGGASRAFHAIWHNQRQCC